MTSFIYSNPLPPVKRRELSRLPSNPYQNALKELHDSGAQSLTPNQLKRSVQIHNRLMEMDPSESPDKVLKLACAIVKISEQGIENQPVVINPDFDLINKELLVQDHRTFYLRSDRLIGSGAAKKTYFETEVKPFENQVRKAARQLKHPNCPIEGVKAEYLLQSSFDHPHIVKVYGESTYDEPFNPDQYEIHSELCDFSLASEESDSLGDEEKLTVLSDIAEALDYLHGLGFAHNDIKPDNILIKEGRGKLTDFGITTKFQTNPPDFIINLLAPENRDLPQDERRVTPATDVYQFGFLLYLLFHPEVESRMGFYDSRITPPTVEQINESWPVELGSIEEQIRDLMEACLNKEPENRPSMQQISQNINNIKELICHQ